MAEYPEIMEEPVSQLGLSKEFEQTCALMGYHTLQDIVKEGRAEIMAKKEFSYRWLEELSRFLLQKELLHLLQPKPGNRYD